MDIIQHSHPLRQSPPQTCTRCGRQSSMGKSVPLLGYFGPECYSKVAALKQVLEQRGLVEFLNGPVQFQPIESEDAHGVSMWVFPSYVQTMKNRAERLGFRFLWDWPRTDGPATAELKLPHGDNLRKRLVGKLERLGTAA